MFSDRAALTTAQAAEPRWSSVAPPGIFPLVVGVPDMIRRPARTSIVAAAAALLTDAAGSEA